MVARGRAGIRPSSNVGDAKMIADFVGKWVPIAKYRMSRDFVLNKIAQVHMVIATVVEWATTSKS